VAAPQGYQTPASYRQYENEPPRAEWRQPVYGPPGNRQDAFQGHAGQPVASAGDSSSYSGGPGGAEYRQTPQGGDYRSGPPADYRQPAQGNDYRPAPASNDPAQPYRANYRDAWQQNSAPQNQPASAYGHDPNEYRAPNHSPVGVGASAPPAERSPYYQADRQSNVAGGYAPYAAQPAGAQFQGTIEQPPAPARYDNTGSRLY